jgi:hypothetical protein
MATSAFRRARWSNRIWRPSRRRAEVRAATACPPRVSGSTGPELPTAPPTDPAGFIYPAYRAAHTDTDRDKSLLKGSHRGVACVSSSVGGSVSTLSFEDTTTKNRLSPSRRRGGGIRERVRGFSWASRRNLLRSLACINRDAFRAFKGRVIFVTLAYPHSYPEDPERCKGHLKALRKRLQRQYGTFAAFWRLGIQQRGAFHFHLLLFVGQSVGPIICERSGTPSDGGYARTTPRGPTPPKTAGQVRRNVKTGAWCPRR